MNVRVKNSLNADEFPKRPEINKGVSKTVPDQSLSLREIMIRFASGLPLGGIRQPEWHGEYDEMPDVEHMDYAEREAYFNNMKQEMDELSDKIQFVKQKQVIARREADLQYFKNLRNEKLKKDREDLANEKANRRRSKDPEDAE